MPLHFLLDDASIDVEVGGAVVLDGTEAHHAAVVRRVRSGESVTVGDGRGTWATGVVREAAARHVVIEIDRVVHRERPHPRVVLAQALAKGDRDELAVQAATELGVDEVIPWQAARSVSRWDAAKAEKGVARWRSIVREASKQAHRAWVPEVHPAMATARLAEEAGLVLVLEPGADVPLTQALSSARDGALSGADARIVLVVGPEGGIAPEEFSLLDDAGATRVRLGETVLRTSTAGPAALALVNVALGRW